MARKFSDLHCHNHMRAHFQMQEKKKKIERKGEFSPWTVIASNKKNQEAGKMGASYSQIDLVKCWNSNLRLTFNSMYPLERDFVKGMKPQIGEDKWYKFLIAFATSHKLPLRDFIQVAYMRIPDRMVDYVQSSDYDYWESLNREYEFVSMDSGKVIPKNEIYLPGNLLGRKRAELKRARQYPKEYLATNSSYRIPKTKQELQDSLINSNEITMVLSIEGTHSFGTDRVQSIQEVSDRIQHMKNEWDYPVFFITFAHHFDNKLCGHAHSIPDSGKLLLNQRKRMNQGFNDNGRRIIREILGLDRHLEKEPNLGYRTLIDVKHMSARSRQEYYGIVKNCLAKGDRIPVIASHCGYSGITTLDKHIELEAKEKDDYTDPSGKFNAWNINMCDEDIQIIVQTRGLFGLSFDQRILGITKKDKNTSRNGIQLIWENIEGIIKSAFENTNLSDSEKLQIWKSLTIGTDFEGLIDPVNPYPTALEFETFSENLISIIDQERLDASKPHLAHLQSREDVENTVNNFCYHNSEFFVLENFPV